MDHPAPTLDERLAFLFLRQAPFLPSAVDLGIATCPVEPWPHQLRVVRETTRRFPESFLFCDEVGLGKTIEAGLALRQLVISGRVRRALLLVPRGLLRQWQEELHEKLVLRIPRYEGGRFLDIDDGEIPTPSKGTEAWNAHPLVLASSQLARRRDRRDELLAADPWDLVIVDEAHHARRRAWSTGSAQPNRLLELLAGTPRRPGLKHRTRCLYLLTATPMQIHPLEVWDLLRLLGLGGRWGAREESFLSYFEELRRPFAQRDWPHLLKLFAESLELSEGFDPPFLRQLEDRLELDDWRSLEEVLKRLPSRRSIKKADPRKGEPRNSQVTKGFLAEVIPLIERLQGEARLALDSLLHHHTPLLTFAWRNTRELLRRYQRRGLLKSGVPKRRPHNVWIDFSAKERELYRRIEVYIAESYQRYEARRPGLGFVMTIYRRRLTSSFFAIRRSLERRLAWLAEQGREGTPPLNVEDLAGEELFLEELPTAPPLFTSQGQDERAYLKEFLHDLKRLRGDSKRTRLRRDLRKLLRERPSALVFTQYTDTLDHLRDLLRQDHQDQVACFSGRGGEVWDGGGWAPCGKELLKERFRNGEVRILLATEAAGEGLNLQSCGILINYDMPWNPMRVEQRIGRLDRIGQVFEEVWIYNYFYSDTVEAEIYRRLADRIHWFEEVVGKLQPILHGVGESIRQVAMAPAEQRTRHLEEEVGRLQQQLEKHNDSHREWLELDGDLALLEDSEPPSPSPVSWQQIESAMLQSSILGPLFTPDAEIHQAYSLELPPGRPSRVTFSPQVFDHHPYSLDLLTYGNSLFHELLTKVEPPEEGEDPQGIGLYRSERPAPVSLILRPTAQGAEPVLDLAALQQLQETGIGSWRGTEEGAASTVFSQERKRVLRRMSWVIERRRQARHRALVQTARQILTHTALVELARNRTPTLFDEPLPYGFGHEAVAALVRHGSPFPELLATLDGEILEARPDDPFYHSVEGRSPAHLDNRWVALKNQGQDVLDELHRLEANLLEARRNLREPSSGGLLKRTWFPLGEGTTRESDPAFPLPILDPAEIQPFNNAVPLYSDLTAALHRFIDSEENTPAGHVQSDEERHPQDYTWVALQGRTRPASGLFVAQAGGGAMDRRLSAGSWCLFRLLHHPKHRATLPRNGQIVLASHHGLEDPGYDRGFGLRFYTSEEQPPEDGGWPVRCLTLGVASSDEQIEPLVLAEEEADGLLLLAELIEILG